MTPKSGIANNNMDVGGRDSDSSRWQDIIATHPMESHDAKEWISYGVALLQTIEPGPDVGKQQQQAALAFVQALKEGAAESEVRAAQVDSALNSLRRALHQAGITAQELDNQGETDGQRHAIDQQTIRSETKRALIVVVGNCQSAPLTTFLRNTFTEAEVWNSETVHETSKENVEKLHARLKNASLLIANRVVEGYRENIGLDTARLRRELPADAQTLVVPTLHYEAYYPWIGYAKGDAGRQSDENDASPLGPYHDFLAMAAADTGIKPKRLLDHMPSNDVAQIIQRLQRETTDQLRWREQECHVGMADWIEQQYRFQPLFHTVNHPTKILLDELFIRLCSETRISASATPDLSDSVDHLGELSIPIHPWVIHALNLGAWAWAWGQRQGEQISWDQQLMQSIEFYQEHVDLIAANRKHTKFALAAEILEAIPDI